jgi:RNA polymerase sigma factor (sigma-70 family)
MDEPGLSTVQAALVVRHLPLAKSLAGGWAARGGEELDDARSDAFWGLVLAARRFDAGRGAFATFAMHAISGEMRRGRQRRSGVQRERFYEAAELESTGWELVQPLGRIPKLAEVAQTLNWSESHAVRVATRNRRPVSLELTLGEDLCLGDTLPARSDPGPELSMAIDTLVAREQLVIRLYYWWGLSQAEIGLVLGCHQVHVSRIQATAQHKLALALAG